ncbi:MAG TPA: hypothetical protein VF303_02970 [Candidatus Nanoarchaeia archaeon]
MKKQKSLGPLGIAIVLVAAAVTVAGILYPILEAKEVDSEHPI